MSIHPVDGRDDTKSIDSIVALLTASNHFGASDAPQAAGATPGWYFGDHPASANGIPWLKDPLCASLAATPNTIQCPAETAFEALMAEVSGPPPPRGEYTVAFSGLNASIVAPDFLTFGLVDTDTDCQIMCDNVSGCFFVDSYRDVNGQGGSTLLTCSLYAEHHDASQATNFGGQTQPDGSVDFIIDSNGYDRH
ncbi:hypothetical protein GYMLUDRAFT_180291 [Collybiopsis luxurians FD-317 M1]|uniref:Fruit-body specific protein a n=1 Tax=Collybiopsis luxurians FD-317 M1 TaxID=944289 RepID=A0A0D0BCT8_9AGAR|nr:hypothetical protein GYMLUDRAFT_180291 [Collybiopsis luxurians FD-317 M1]